MITNRTTHDAMAEIPEGTELVNMTVREALRDAMAEEMRRDASVFVMGEEVAEYQGAYKVTQGLLQEFGPKRVVDTPITEHGFAGLGVGAAFVGPEADRRVHDLQLRHAGDRPHHQLGGQDPLHVRRPARRADRVPRPERRRFARRRPAQPRLRRLVLQRAGPEGGDALHGLRRQGLLKSAIRDPNPIVFLENEILYGQSFPVPKLDDFTVPIGKARIHREGKHVTIVSWGIGMTYALKAAHELEKEGIEAELVDLRTIRPMDTDTVVASVQKTGRCVTVEEGFPQSGVGAEVGMRIMEAAFDYLDAPVARVTGKDVPMPYAANLEKLALPSVAEVVAGGEGGLLSLIA